MSNRVGCKKLFGDDRNPAVEEKDVTVIEMCRHADGLFREPIFGPRRSSSEETHKKQIAASSNGPKIK